VYNSAVQPLSDAGQSLSSATRFSPNPSLTGAKLVNEIPVEVHINVENHTTMAVFTRNSVNMNTSNYILHIYHLNEENKMF